MKVFDYGSRVILLQILSVIYHTISTDKFWSYTKVTLASDVTYLMIKLKL